MKKLSMVLVAVLLVVVVAGGAWWLLADKESNATGSCGQARWEMSAEAADDAQGEDQVEVTFELRSGSPGETWKVDLKQGETSVLSGQRQTDDDAELDLEAVVPASDGDTFTVTATPVKKAQGSTCTATLTR